METVGADALAQSLDADEHITLPAITSIATSLGAIRVSERAFELAREGRANGTILNAVLTDAEAAMGCWRLADDERLLVDIACGVNVAICYGGRLQRILGRAVKAEEKIVIVLCGGSGISIELLEAWRREFGDLGDATTNGDMSDVPSQVNVPASRR
jgi:L-serine/L-threonine ammonia-lyase